MPGRHEWLDRIKAVEREFKVIQQAAEQFFNAARRDPTILRRDIRRQDVERASRNLESTYVIRLFAEFESGAREFWATKRATHPRTSDLLDSICGLQKIPDDFRDNAHLVRKHRNSLVHERGESSQELSIDGVRSSLCTFFAFLPLEW